MVAEKPVDAENNSHLSHNNPIHAAVVSTIQSLLFHKAAGEVMYID
jgi:hypothetical protein